MKKPLTDYKALVTGGTSGIGRAIALRLVEEGASVTVTGRGQLVAGPKECSYRCVDFTDIKQTEKFAMEIADADFQILVNNAGINIIDSVENVNMADYDHIQQVNVRAPFLLSKAVLSSMRRKCWGRIVNIGSVFGVVSRSMRGAYSTSKFAINGMTAAMAAEAASDDVLINCVSPGFIDTGLTRGILGENGVEEIVKMVPMRRLGKPEEVAALVAWLVGPENSFISGQNIIIDGGFTRV